ncbi:MAG: hypothetical protein HY673_01055 [Chloroflexi bacterium]|nr:hypothetical protein [Chloroflexota bacterium]
MLVIDKNTVAALRDRVLSGEDPSGCRDELKKLIEIKSSLQWRAETAYSCVGWALPAQLAWEVKTLEEALWDLDHGKRQEAAGRLSELISIMDR